ncbi:unnamed protein product [Brassica rapa]|uniref:Uncharacterized protein n=1 Tax=Brassica campestris TaxID=3711 RepID=A0A8D9DNG4_BRACM|nr:unnamed protein product [Brassica rapa]
MFNTIQFIELHISSHKPKNRAHSLMKRYKSIKSINMKAETRENENTGAQKNQQRRENSVHKKRKISGFFLPLLKQSTQSDEKHKTQKCLSLPRNKHIFT